MSAEAFAKAEAATDAFSVFGSELAAISGSYAARIAAARAGLSPRDIAAAVRAIQNEQIAAVRAVMERWGAAKRALTQKRQVPKLPAETRSPIHFVTRKQPI